VDRGTTRLLIALALAVIGGFVLYAGFDGDSGVSAAGASPTASVSPSVSPTPTGDGTPTDQPSKVEPQPPEEVLFMALNGTTVTGAGAAAQDLMEEAGYVPAKVAGDSPVQGAQVTTVLYRGGDDEAQNRANAKEISKTVFKGSEVAELSNDYEEGVPADATIVIVVGADLADQIV
jgi:hypothetical protein